MPRLPSRVRWLLAGCFGLGLSACVQSDRAGLPSAFSDQAFADDCAGADAACPPGDLEQELLEQVNEARAQARMCGDTQFDAAGPLAWNSSLAEAAQVHSDDMVEMGFFAHTGSDGLQVAQRVNATGYDWRAVGENIAAGFPSASSVLEGWLASPGHCANIMSREFSEMGAGLTDSQSARDGLYWTQVLARPRNP